MENHDKNKIEQIVKTRKQAHGYYLKNSRVYQSFVEMEQKIFHLLKDTLMLFIEH
jgi:hypothetical protein